MAKVFNEHLRGLEERLADKTVGQFDPTVLKALVNERKVSDSKLAFPPITPSQTHHLIKAIPSCKATGLDDVSARLLKIAAPAVAPYHLPNLSTSVLLMDISSCVERGQGLTLIRILINFDLHK